MDRAIIALILVLFTCPVFGSEGLSLSWHAANLGTEDSPWFTGQLSVRHPRLPDEGLEIMYPEAFCRPGSTKRSWKQTVIQQKTKLISSARDGLELILVSEVGENVRVEHVIRLGEVGLEFALTLVNHGKDAVELEWVQTACVQVGSFTGLDQENYYTKCFIFTDDGLTLLPATHRETEGYYVPGQVYVPDAINRADVNPRPVSRTRPSNGLIGCFSFDQSMILATAWEPTHELFQGVLNCIHNDPHVGGLKPGEVKEVRGKVYIMENDTDALLRHYKADFPADPTFSR